MILLKRHYQMKTNILTPLEFINAYFNEDEHFFITFIDHQKNGYAQNYLHNKESFRSYYNAILKKNNSLSAYFTFNAFKARELCKLNDKGFISKCKDNVSNIKGIVFDFDEPSVSLEYKDRLISSLGIKPTYTLSTSPNKYQIYFKLKDENIDFIDFELVNKSLSIHFKSDKNVCSIEKLFRLPFSVNRKNDYQTNLIDIDFNNSYNFSHFRDYVLNNPDINIIYEELKAKKLKIKPMIKHLEPNNSTKTVREYNDKLEINNSILSKYIAIFKRLSDASKVDILFIKERKKQGIAFEDIFNEILTIRNKIGKPLQRDINSYFVDRKSLFER